MKRFFILLIFLVIVVVVGLRWLIDRPKPYQLISKQYNLSVGFPEQPTIETSVNDEGLPKTDWKVRHDRVTYVEFYDVSATCYNEELRPEKEFVGADNDPVLALNGVKVLKSERMTVQALETGRELPAYSRVSQDTATGNIMGHRVILDGHCMIDSGVRIDHNAGPASLFLESIKMLR